MERTPMREELFRLAQDDPYMAMLQKMWVQAYAAGYEALAEDEDLECESHSDLCEKGIEALTRSRRQAEEVVALAMLGTKLERLASDHIARLMDPKNIERGLFSITIPPNDLDRLREEP